MSTSITLRGTNRSQAKLPKRNPFTGEITEDYVYEMTPSEREAADRVLVVHGFEEGDDGDAVLKLPSDRHPGGVFPLSAERLEDGAIGFFGNASTSTVVLAILLEAARAGNLAIEGGIFAAVTSEETKARLEGWSGPPVEVVTSVEELIALVQMC
jgi:hypothetical protein